MPSPEHLRSRKLSRYVPLIVGFLLGIAAGLLYGWFIRPTQIPETTPSSLSEEYRADFVLMTAEAYAEDEDIQKVRQRLSVLGPQSAEEVTSAALSFALANEFSVLDISILKNLLDSLKEIEPSPEIRGP